MVDPRVERTRQSVLETAAAIVAEGGPSALTIDAVVARSGVARSTIYRHWPTRDDLLVAVFFTCAPVLTPPAPELAFVDALRAFLQGVRRQLADPKWARMFPALLLLKAHEPAVAGVEAEFTAHQEAAVDALFARGIAEGVLPADLDRDRASALLVGPLLFTLVVGKGTLDEAFTDAVVDSFLAGVAARR